MFVTTYASQHDCNHHTHMSVITFALHITQHEPLKHYTNMCVITYARHFPRPLLIPPPTRRPQARHPTMSAASIINATQKRRNFLYDFIFVGKSMGPLVIRCRENTPPNLGL